MRTTRDGPSTSGPEPDANPDADGGGDDSGPGPVVVATVVVAVLLVVVGGAVPPVVGSGEASSVPAVRLATAGAVEPGPGPTRGVTATDAPATDAAWVASGPNASGGPDALSAVGASDLHRRGVTGERVTVGVIGSAFDADHEALAGRVAAHRRVVPTTPLATGAHDTAVAEVVAGTAPGAELYLVGIGRQPTPAEYESAVSWLVARDVDVVVDAGSYFPADPAAAAEITGTAERAAADGVVFVTSAGNYARRHWTGGGPAPGDEWVTFDRATATQANPLADGNRTSGAVSLRLDWNSSADYDLYVYRRFDDRPDRVIAASTRGPGEAEAVDVVVPPGRYYVAAYASEGAAPTDRLELFSARQSLAHATASGSVVAPGTSEAVITVGAVEGGERAAYSSSGPLVDVGAPGSVGTSVAGRVDGSSAAAPVVAGTAALMRSRNASLSPTETERLIERTAADDRLDAAAAVRAAGGGTAVGPTTGNGTARP